MRIIAAPRMCDAGSQRISISPTWSGWWYLTGAKDRSNASTWYAVYSGTSDSRSGPLISRSVSRSRMPTRSIVGGVANTGAAGQASAKTGNPPEWSMCACVKRTASTRVSVSIDRSGRGLAPEYRTPQSTTKADPATRTRMHEAPIELAPPRNELSMVFRSGMGCWMFVGDTGGPRCAENDSSVTGRLAVDRAVSLLSVRIFRRNVAIRQECFEP